MQSLLVLTPTREPTSGWGRYSHEVLARLDDRFDLVVLDDLPDPTAMIEILPGTTEVISRPDRLLGAVRRTRAAVRDVDAVLSLVGFPYSLIASLATWGTDTPYFVCCHGTFAVRPLHSPLVGWVAGRSFANAAQLFVASSFTADRMRERIPDLENVTVVPNGVDTASFDPADSFDLDHRVALTVGTLKPRKGQDVAVEAFARVADEFPDLHQHFVGRGEGSAFADEVRRIADRRGVADRVHLEGGVAQDVLERWYASADVFVLPSQYVAHDFEGFGIVYLEANRYGVPAIGPNDCGAVDAIAHGRSGLCVDNDAESFADALRAVLGDEERYESLSRGASEWAREHTWDRTATRIADGIDALCRDG